MVSEGTRLPPGAHDPVDRGAADYALQVGASGRGAVIIGAEPKAAPSLCPALVRALSQPIEDGAVE